MKYTLINCYSDNNRGDLAIILATIKLLKKHDTNADIKGISTYNYSDPCYTTEHLLLNEYIEVFPALFGVVNVGSSRALPLKILRLIFDTLRLCLSWTVPKSLFWPLVSKIYTREERKSIKLICDSDYVISKGGSFICSERNLRSQVALIRVLYIFLLSIKLGKNPIILCQSIGPYYGWLTRRATNYVLSKCSAVILREDVCIEQYKYIQLPTAVEVSTDIAFFADSIECDSDIVFANDRLRIGVTIKYVDSSKAENYKKMFVCAIEHCVKNHNAHIYVFPHVTIESDIDNAFEIYRSLDDSVKPYVTIFSLNYHALKLKSLYRKMDIFIGTRLHSTIFAIAENVPSICISYHGTKSAGVFKTVGLGKYVVTEYSATDLITIIDDIIVERNNIKLKIKGDLHLMYVKLNNVLKKLFPIV